MSEATAVATSSPSMPWRSLMPWVISLAVMAVLPFLFEGGTAFTLMNVIGINIVFAMSYNMLLGQGGMLSFGHAVFFGMGSYAAMHAMNAIDEASYTGEGFWAHIPVVSMPLVGMIAGGLVALVEPAVNTVAFYFHERLWQRLETRTLRLSDSADVAIDASRSTPLVA